MYRERVGLSKNDEGLCLRARGGYSADMTREPPGATGGPGAADLARVFSPLLFFVAHVIYLAGWSREPFLNKWIDGSFTFFVALVLCNIIRARVMASADRGHGGPAGDEHPVQGDGDHDGDREDGDGDEHHRGDGGREPGGGPR
jgi:hypothetical protein